MVREYSVSRLQPAANLTVTFELPYMEHNGSYFYAS